jgi:hypothetical protein
VCAWGGRIRAGPRNRQTTSELSTDLTLSKPATSGPVFSSNLYGGDLDRGGQSHESLIAAFEQSLRTDYIDLYWLCN